MAPTDISSLDPVARAKAEAIIKDASQFWLAILVTLLCSSLGGLIIGPWYLVRLLQWNSLKKSEAELAQINPPPGSLAAQFQSAKVKLIVGLCFGAMMLLLGIMVFLLMFVGAVVA